MYYYRAPDTVKAMHMTRPALFLAGGITGCEDWQWKMRELLANTHLLLLNPRRADFPIGDPDAAQAQIEWEHRHLCMANAVSFWFPCETLCPIALFELGAWAYARRPVCANNDFQLERKPIFVGVHPDYQRKQDVEIQMKLARPEVEVVYDLVDLACQIEKWADAL